MKKAFMENEEFIIGEPGNPPRLIAFTTYDNALANVKDGEVIFTQVNHPTPSIINDEGTALIAKVDTAEEQEAKAWSEIRVKRVNMIDEHRWTWMPDSPLSNADEWLAWAKVLHRLTVDYETSKDVVWPEKPQLLY